jgi:hypothetical protein
MTASTACMSLAIREYMAERFTATLQEMGE